MEIPCFIYLFIFLPCMGSGWHFIYTDVVSPLNCTISFSSANTVWRKVIWWLRSDFHLMYALWTYPCYLYGYTVPVSLMLLSVCMWTNILLIQVTLRISPMITKDLQIFDYMTTRMNRVPHKTQKKTKQQICYAVHLMISQHPKQHWQRIFTWCTAYQEIEIKYFMMMFVVLFLTFSGVNESWGLWTCDQVHHK